MYNSNGFENIRSNKYNNNQQYLSENINSNKFNK